MSNYADWTKVTYVNNSAPNITASNLNKNENALENIMGELNSYNSTNLKDFLDYGMNNSVKEIHNFEYESDFTEFGTYSYIGQARHSVLLFGMGGCTLQSLTTGTSAIGMYDNITSIDLTTYPSGVSAGSDDYIVCCFYVSDRTKFTSILLRLGDNDSNCFYKYFVDYETGWNFYKAKKTEFSTNGTPSGWDDITFVRFYVITTTNSSSDYIIFNKLWLGREIPDFGRVSPLRVTNGSGSYNTFMYLQGYDNLITYFDKQIGKKGIHIASKYSNDMLKVMEDINCFSFKCEAYTKIDSEGFVILWYVNSSNYLRIIISGLTFSIVETVNSSTSTINSSTLSTAIEAGDRMMLWIDKTSDNVVRARLEIDGQQPIYTESVLNITSTLSGNLGITKNTNQYYFISDFVANNNPSIPLYSSSNSFQKMIIKFFDETVTSSTTLQNDDELVIKLPSNGLFEVKTIIISSAASGTPDLKVAWDASGDYELFSDGRVIIAAGTTMGNFTDIPLYMNDYALSTSVSTGSFNGGEVPYYERILIKTGDAGCTLQLKWCAVNSTSDSITIKKGSFIKVIKL